MTKRRDPHAKELASPKYRKQVVPLPWRKGRAAEKRNAEKRELQAQFDQNKDNQIDN